MADDKEPRLEVWTTGVYGVNVVDSPLHLEDGELLAAQNAEPFTEEGEGGIRKRLGIDEFTGASLGAAIAAITSVPLPDPDTPAATTGTRIYAPTVAGANTYLTSTDGITWTASAPFERPGRVGGIGLYNKVFQHGGFLSTEGSLYFVREGFGGEATGALMRWDGSSLVADTSNDLDAVFWGLGETRSIHLIDGDVYAIGERGTDNAFVRAAAGAWDDSASGDHSNAHSPWGEFFASAYAWSRLWTPSGTQEMGYWPYSGGVFGAFVDQGIYTGNAGATMLVTDMLLTTFGLIVALDRNGQDPEVLWKLEDAAGTWTDISPAAPNNKGCWGPMAVFGDLLYICRHTDTFGGATRTYTGCELWSYDGTTLTLVKDLTTVVANADEVRSMIVFNDVLYITVYGENEAAIDPTHAIVRTADAVTFTVPVLKNLADDERPRGELGFY